MTDEVTRYVVGFAFDDNDNVLLLSKQRPDWQRGKFNGPGGKVNPGEGITKAMVREFEEETGLPTKEKEWQAFAILMFRRPDDTPFEVHCFRAELGKKLKHARTITDEEVMVVNVALAPKVNAIPNVPWLIFMARDKSLSHAIVIYNPEGS